MPKRTAVYTAVILGVLLSLLGIALVYSASRRIYGMELAVKQGIWLIAGLGLALLVNQLTRKWLNRSTWFLYGIGIILLVATLLFGVKIRGDRSWLDLGVLHLQSSEIMKLFLVLAMARVSQGYSNDDRTLNKTLLIIFPLFLSPFVLVLMQPDLGTALVYLFIFIGWMFVMGLWAEGTVLFIGAIAGVLGVFLSLLRPAFFDWYFQWMVSYASEWGIKGSLGILFLVSSVVAIWPYIRRRRIHIAGGLVLVILAFVMGTFMPAMLEDYQRQRLLVYLNPYESPMESGYNIIQAQIAVGSGGWFGQGYLQGSQSQLGFIPELWTDFVFSVAVEELGFVTGGVLIFLFLLYVYCFFSSATMAADWEAYYISAGLGLIVMTHVFLNLGVCVGIIPVVGLPLPFLSYGGSFLVTNWLILGILTVVTRRLSGQALLKSPPKSKRFG